MALLRGGPPLLPLCPALRPDLGRNVLMRRWQLHRTAMLRAEPFGQPDRGVIVRMDGVDHFVPAQMFERPVDCRDRRFGRETLAPRSTMQAPADLGAGPAFRLPRPHAPEPLPAGFFQ